MLLVDSIQDANTVKNTLAGLIRRSETFGKSREDILFELQCLVEDAENSINIIDEYTSKDYV